jgi:predicted RND superfamily exporter protein
LFGAVAVVAIFGTGIANVRFAQNLLQWFPEDDPIRMSFEFLDREFGGIGGFEFVVDTRRENGLHDPEILNRIERASTYAQSIDEAEIRVAKTISIVDLVKETHKALNENRHAAYVIPQDRRLLAQELLLFENSGNDDLTELTDSQFRYARITMRTPFSDGMHMPPFIEKIEREMRAIFGPEVGIQPTGLGVLFGRTFSIVNPTMAKSYAIALLVITPLMALLLGSVKRGLLAMVPNLIPIWMTLGLMGWLDIPLDNSSLLIGCIVIGLAVDDTIHFMHKFHRYYDQTGDARLAVRRTLETTGAALLFTSLALACGFAVMTLAYMDNAAEFGMLTTFATLSAFFADILISPALMVLGVDRPARIGSPADASAIADGPSASRPPLSPRS